MKFIDQIKNSLSRLLKTNNSIGNDFLRYGNRKMYSGWSDAEISDKDLYTGYSYAAIRNRANKVASLAINNCYTDSNNDKIHPYLSLIQTSRDFSEYKFWNTISTYLDLEGIYYLMAIRKIENGIGPVVSFKMLNPYNIKRVVNKDDLKVVGYVETRKGLIREIPPEMIIEMREVNPFDEELPYAMTDALKENQFTLKTSGDYTRRTLKHNIGAPGIITTDVILQDKQFENFVERIKNNTKGEPLFGNGDGAIKWTDMNIDISKAGLKDINEINRESLFAISGVSKTIMGIEQSGVTRETGKVQSDLNIEYHILPRVQLIIDALNLDYRTKYEKEYKSNEYKIMVEDPTVQDFDKNIKLVEILDKKLNLYNKLIGEGYDEETAAQYANDEIGVESLPKVEEKEPVETDESDESKKKDNKIKNKLDIKEKQKKGLVQQQQGALQNAIVNVEAQVVSSFIEGVSKLTKNSINSKTKKDDFISEEDKNKYVAELILVLAAFYGIVMAWKGQETMRDRISTFVLLGTFEFDKEIKKYIKEISNKVAVSHIDTIINDLYETAMDAAKRGLGEVEIISELRSKFGLDISEERARAIARTEANRAFTMAQYEADKQFIEQNGLEGKAFKKWHTRSSNPCEFCLALEREGMIPFDEAFRDLGETIEVTKDGKTKVLPVDFARLEAGNAHTNCSCEYELIIK